MERGSERSGRYAKDARDPASELRPAAGRIPPSDLDAEAAVLSAVMLSGEAFDSVQEQLAPEHFYSEIGRAHV